MVDMTCHRDMYSMDVIYLIHIQIYMITWSLFHVLEGKMKLSVFIERHVQLNRPSYICLWEAVSSATDTREIAGPVET